MGSITSTRKIKPEPVRWAWKIIVDESGKSTKKLVPIKTPILGNSTEEVTLIARPSHFWGIGE